MEGACKIISTNLSIFSFTFTIGVIPRGITFPSPYLCTILSAIYTDMQPKFQKSSKRCGYSACIASSFSQVDFPQERTRSIGPLQALWLDSGVVLFSGPECVPNALGKRLLVPTKSHSNQ